MHSLTENWPRDQLRTGGIRSSTGQATQTFQRVHASQQRSIRQRSNAMAHTIKNIEDVEDIAAKSGFGELGEARFAREDLDATDPGLSHQRLNPNKRQAFGHHHDQAEEIYLVLAGSGRVKLDDE